MGEGDAIPISSPFVSDSHCQYVIVIIRDSPGHRYCQVRPTVR